MQGSVNDNERSKVYGESDDNNPTGMYSLKIAKPECDPHFVCVCVCGRMAHCVMGANEGIACSMVIFGIGGALVKCYLQ